MSRYALHPIFEEAGCAVQACKASLSNLFGSHPGVPDFYFFKANYLCIAGKSL